MDARRIQSAMEYLMTYGWAILIIAIVLGALFGLGFFNSANLAPKVAAGSCQVYRPNGPGTTSFINLEGTCNNELPEYVSYFTGPATEGNILIQSSPPLNVPGALTVSAWVKMSSKSTNNQDQEIVVKGVQSHTTSGYELNYGWGNDIYFWIGNSGTAYSVSWTGPSSDIGQFVYLTATLDSGGNMKLYYDGQLENTATGNPATITENSNPLYIGGGAANYYGTGYGGSVNGLISDVQIYNTSLSANEIAALYQEGIGGVPTVLNNLVGWWPLNGNSNDYSGNLDNGIPTNVVFTSSWTASYTAP